MSPDLTLLQRVILPRDTDPLDVRPMYLDEPEHVHCHVSSRWEVTVPPAALVSFGSYFNAFPASYWRRWTVVDKVTLVISARGAGRVDVYRSNAGGDTAHLTGQPVRSPGEWTRLEFVVDITPFEDGGWVWFDVFTDDTALEIAEAAWATPIELPRQRVSIGISTFNRPDDCVGALLALGEDPVVLDLVDKVYVSDQGNRKIADHPRFADAAKGLEERLELIEQDNLGGSGGFTRALYESVVHSDVEQIMLMDDDIMLEPDTVLRANAFARAAADPVIVGCQMLNLLARSRLHSSGEVVDLGTCMWRAAPGAVEDHDFGQQSLRRTRELHRRIDVTYNGWWSCLFPREVVERTGFPLPLFIKWEDAEYSLRALANGYPTVSLPGAAVWHMPWTNKNDSSDWTAYFHLRNRLILSALHTPYDVRKTLLRQGLRATLGRLLNMQYSTVAIEQQALEDFMAGPDRLFEMLRTKLPEVQAIRREYPDAQLRSSAREFPPPTFDVVRAEQMLRRPHNPAKLAARAAVALVHNLRAPDESAAQRPQVNVPAASARWYLLGNLDSATVSSPDGSGVAFRHRDPKLFRELSRRAAQNYRRLIREWPRLREVYRAALPELTAEESWRKVFEN